eukprot:GHVN01050464.1.p1 GENE.GHVN01050464.1~~GHVN01050464.1.p1  ORF type:complete len:556 (+),score=93.20 GHVN01050464.1:167-1834(+)
MIVPHEMRSLFLLYWGVVYLKTLTVGEGHRLHRERESFFPMWMAHEKVDDPLQWQAGAGTSNTNIDVKATSDGNVFDVGGAPLATDIEVADVVVIGGGITGVTTTHRLINHHKIPSVVLLESSSSCGGCFGTHSTQKSKVLKQMGLNLPEEADKGSTDFIFELGANSFAMSPRNLDQLRSLGLSESIVQASHTLPRFLFAADVQQPVIVPTTFGELASSSLLSLRGKLALVSSFFGLRRSLKDKPNDPDGSQYSGQFIGKEGDVEGEPHMTEVEGEYPHLQAKTQRRLADSEETLVDFGHRVLGKEVTDKLLIPYSIGTYAADPTKLSMQAAFPQVAAVEKRWFGLARKTLASRMATVLAFILGEQFVTDDDEVEGESDVIFNGDTKLESNGAIIDERVADGDTARSVYRDSYTEDHVNSRNGKGVIANFKFGMSGVIDHLVKEMPSDVVRLNHWVERVRWVPSPLNADTDDAVGDGNRYIEAESAETQFGPRLSGIKSHIVNRGGISGAQRPEEGEYEIYYKNPVTHAAHFIKAKSVVMAVPAYGKTKCRLMQN